MKILYLAHRIPFPPNKGEKIRAFHQLQYLTKQHEVHLVCLVDNKQDLAYVKDLSSYCYKVHFAFISPIFAKLKSLLFLIFSSKPLSVHYFSKKKLKQIVKSTLAQEQFDLIIAYCSPMAEYIPDNCETKKVMDFVDADSDKWKQYAQHSRGAMHFLYKLEAKRLYLYEQKIIKSWHKCFAISEAEAKYIGEQVVVLANGVDTDYFLPQKQKKEDAIVFVGTMDYLPNVDAMIYFCHEIWDHVVAQCPNAKLYIVGRNPNKNVLALQKKNIMVTGAVSDIRNYLNIAKVGIAPIRIARGIQNKILEYIAMDLPTVISSEGAKGIDFQNIEDGVWIEDEPIPFAKKIIHCLQNDTAIPEMRRDHFCKKYSWEIHLQKWEQDLVEVTQHI